MLSCVGGGDGFGCAGGVDKGVYCLYRRVLFLWMYVVKKI